jgi:hypothetical protein
MRANEPAFARPAFAPDGVGCEDCEISASQDGLTIREYFAAKAMQALITRDGVCKPHIPSNSLSYPDLAAKAVAMADAMIEALK